MTLKTALMALAMGCFVFGNVGCGNACDSAADLATDLCPVAEGGSGGGTAEEPECTGTLETQAQCVVDADPADCDALIKAYADCASEGGGGSGS